MAFDDRHCACGSTSKAPGELLCDACREAAQGVDAWSAYSDLSSGTEIRRAAAIFLLMLARRRGRETARHHATIGG